MCLKVRPKPQGTGFSLQPFFQGPHGLPLALTNSIGAAEETPCSSSRARVRAASLSGIYIISDTVLIVTKAVPLSGQFCGWSLRRMGYPILRVGPETSGVVGWCFGTSRRASDVTDVTAV